MLFKYDWNQQLAWYIDPFQIIELWQTSKQKGEAFSDNYCNSCNNKSKRTNREDIVVVVVEISWSTALAHRKLCHSQTFEWFMAANIGHNTIHVPEICEMSGICMGRCSVQ